MAAAANCENMWVIPDEKELREEYYKEYEIKSNVKNTFDDPFPTVDDFVRAANRSYTLELTKESAGRINNLSKTNSFETLHDLIKSYRSYGTFRTEKTLRNLYERIRNCEPTYMPIVLMTSDKMFVLAGNTRINIALQLGIRPTVLLIDLDFKQRGRADRNAAIERKISHWVRRITVSALEKKEILSTKKNNNILVGGVLALEYYLQGDALERWHASKFFMPPVVYYCGPHSVKDYGSELAETMNASAMGESVSLQLVLSLRYSGVNVSYAKMKAATKQNKLFFFSQKKNEIILDIGSVSQVASRITILQIVAVDGQRKQGSKKTDPLFSLMCDNTYLKKKLGQTFVMHPALRAPLIPFGHMLTDNHTTTRASRAHLLQEFLQGSTVLHTPMDDTLELQTLPYHFALKTIRDAFRRDASFIDDSKWNSFHRQLVRELIFYKPHRRVSAGVQSSPLPVDLVNMANMALSVSLSVYEEMTVQSQTNVQDPESRYSRETKEFKTIADTVLDERLRKTLYKYTSNSFSFNAPLIEASIFPNKPVEDEYKENIENLKKVFDIVKHLKEHDDNEKQDMYVYRGHDLIELPEQTDSPGSVYNKSLPFFLVSNSFSSTSASFNRAQFFRTTKGNFTPCCSMRIRVPPDFAAYLPLEKLSRIPAEKEVLFPVGTTFRVDERKYFRTPDKWSQLLLLECTAVATPNDKSRRTEHTDASSKDGSNIGNSGDVVRGGKNASGPKKSTKKPNDRRVPKTRKRGRQVRRRQ